MLGRMGAAARALELIIGRLADVPAAIAFVQAQVRWQVESLPFVFKLTAKSFASLICADGATSADNASGQSSWVCVLLVCHGLGTRSSRPRGEAPVTKDVCFCHKLESLGDWAVPSRWH